jgi:hypothetical protein
MPKRVRPILNGSLFAAACIGLAACSSTPGAGPPAPALGVTAHQSEKFFKSLGGGPWGIGRYTGGLVGPASGGANGIPCQVLMGGSAISINRILLYCASTPTGTFQQAQSVIEDTVRHFVPDGSMWTTQKLAEINDPSNPLSASRAFDGKSVQIVSSGGADPRLSLTIVPTQLATPPTTTPA